MNIVPRKNTNLTREATRTAVANAWREVLEREPEPAELAMILALVWIETGSGGSCQNWNLGNITASTRYAGDAWRPPWFDEPTEATKDRDRRLHELMKKGQAPSAFRAYGSLEAGALDFVRTLERDFPEVLEAARTSDPDAFREALSLKYSGDYKNPDSTRTLAALFKEFGGVPKARAAGAGLSSSAPPLSLPSASLPALRVGSRGLAVDVLRGMLWRLGRHDTPIAGQVFSLELKARVEEYQRSRGLTVDGIVGDRQTWPALLRDMRIV